MSTRLLTDPDHQICSALPAQVMWDYALPWRGPLCLAFTFSKRMFSCCSLTVRKNRLPPTSASFLTGVKPCMNINTFSLLQPWQEWLQSFLCSNGTAHIWYQLITFTNSVQTKSLSPLLAIANRTLTCDVKWLQSSEEKDKRKCSAICLAGLHRKICKSNLIWNPIMNFLSFSAKTCSRNNV